MKPLALIDDLWHPGAIVRDGLAGHGDFDWLVDGRAWSTELLKNRRLVVLAKANHINWEDKSPWADEVTGAAFLRYLESGGGLLVIHGGLSGYSEIPAMRDAVTGGFLHHPPQCAVTVEPVGEHPLTAEVDAFTEVDEHYFVEVHDPAAAAFLRSVSVHGVHPAGWTSRRGAGRVCVLTPGHTPAVWLNPNFQTLLRNAFTWCNGEGQETG